MAVVVEEHISKFTHSLTLHLRGLAGWGVRLWIARQLFKIGALIAGVNIVIEDEEPTTK